MTFNLKTLEKKIIEAEQKVDYYISLSHQSRIVKDFVMSVRNTREMLHCIENDHDYHEVLPLVNDIVAKADCLVEDVLLEKQQNGNETFIEIIAGTGGQDAQLCADIILNLYLTWCKLRKFNLDLQYKARVESGGIRSATVFIEGKNVHGLLTTEAGIHRIVRKSPFNLKRHTSFVAVSCHKLVPEQDIILPSYDLKIMTSRSSGPGGQHANTTNSAVRITHLPTQITVQSQSSRYQHQNKIKALAQLRAKIKQFYREQQTFERPTPIEWGNHIRSYILDKRQVVDHRSHYKSTQVDAVLSGHIDAFILSYLKHIFKNHV